MKTRLSPLFAVFQEFSEFLQNRDMLFHHVVIKKANPNSNCKPWTKQVNSQPWTFSEFLYLFNLGHTIRFQMCPTLCPIMCPGHIGHMFYCAQLFINCAISTIRLTVGKNSCKRKSNKNETKNNSKSDSKQVCIKNKTVSVRITNE